MKARIGVLPEGLRLFDRLTGRELLSCTGRLRGLPGAGVDRRATQMLDVLDLAGAQHKLVVDYSTGRRKKTGPAAALLEWFGTLSHAQSEKPSRKGSMAARHASGWS